MHITPAIFLPALKAILRTACLAVAVLAAENATAQNKKEEENVPVYNYVIDDPMDVFGRQQPPAAANKTVLLPEFCAYAGITKDTVRRYEYYNAANELINADTLSDYRLLRFVSMLEGYTDTEHTYRDAAGKMQPLPVSKITYRYDRISNDKWLCVRYKSNKTLRLQEHVNDIVKTDTVHSTDGTTVIRKYYRITEIP